MKRLTCGIATGFTSDVLSLVTMRTVARLISAILLLGQLVQVSGAAFCGLVRAADAAHCEDGMVMPAGASFAPAAQDVTGMLCGVIGPCRGSAPAVTVAATDDPLPNVNLPGMPAAAARPPSFNPALITPPPQA